MGIRKVNDLVKICIISMHDQEGFTKQRIADELGLSRTTVTNVLNYGSNQRANESYARRSGYRNYAEYLREFRRKEKSYSNGDFLLNKIIYH